MKDIFISHSSKDIDKVREVCRTLVEDGYSCWISESNGDLGVGKIYTAAIAEAIRTCKIFIVLLSHNSVVSEQVHQEVIMANDNQKYGLRIIPILLDDDLEPNRYHPNIDLVLSGKEVILWNELNVSYVKNEIDIFLDCKIEDVAADIISSDIQESYFCGRESEIKSIQETLSKERRVCIYGIGGIGKTAIAEAIGLRERADHRVIFAKVDKGIFGVLADDDAVNVIAEGLDEIKRQSSDYVYSLYKLKLLQINLSSDDLIIFDNVDLDKDLFVDKVLEIGCRVLFTSRTRSKKRYGIKEIELSAISDQHTVMQIFRNYFKREMSEQETQDAYRIFDLANYNTLSIVLMGQQMNYWGESPSDYLSDNQFTITRRHNMSPNAGTELRSTYDMIAKLIDACMLNRSDRIVLKTMTLLPVKGYSKVEFQRFIGEKYEETISNLEFQGWICRSDSGAIYLHPIVRELILTNYELDIEDVELRDFVEGFISSIEDSWNRTFDENISKKNLVLSVYYNFPKPTKYTYSKYLVMSKFLWIINCIDVSIQIQNSVKRLFVDGYGKHSNSTAEGECALQIGFTYQGKGDYEQAETELLRAVRIFGNKYAAALSHLAQAKMYAEPDCVLENVEWMLSDSLNIRKKQMPGSLSEAASNHLYAKVLSNFETNLEQAIEMEKSALKYFSKTETNGVNVSSAKYILGWLFVQTAEDNEDIEDGIRYIEEAKEIRLKHRGDALHPWMEDVYRKLGLSYFKLGDYEKAKEYYELLEQLLENKYVSNPYGNEFYDTYGVLADIHSKLGNADDERKYRKKQKHCFR